jgi:hypothetical protein
MVGAIISDRDFDRLAARWAYARSHDQSQFKNGSDR